MLGIGFGNRAIFLLLILNMAGWLGLMSGCERASSQLDSGRSVPERPIVGFRAPAFSGPSVDGRGLSLEDYRGKVLLINFWATWCIPCRVEMPSMEHLYDKFGRDDFEILAISGGEDMDVVKPFIDHLQLSFPILLDRRFEVHGKYHVNAIPSSYLVDRTGLITHRFFGALDWNDDQHEELIAKLIKSK